jgi:hypothetical protein
MGPRYLGLDRSTSVDQRHQRNLLNPTNCNRARISDQVMASLEERVPVGIAKLTHPEAITRDRSGRVTAYSPLTRQLARW